MKKSPLYLFLLFLLQSFSVNSAVYKCEDANGKITYRGTTCDISETLSEVKATTASTKKSKPSSAAKSSEPAGNWVNEKGMTAYLSPMGNFQMKDISGAALAGKWETKGKKYLISARFRGESFPVNMKYDDKKDLLYLSKPGLPNSYSKYTRR